jgi:hypothetical protein
MASHATASPQGKIRARTARLSVVPMDGAFIKPNAVRSRSPPSRLILGLETHGADHTVMLSLIKALESVGWRMENRLWRADQRVSSFMPFLPSRSGHKKTPTCRHGTSDRGRKRRQRTPDTSQAGILVSPSLQSRNPLRLFELRGVKLLQLFEDAPDIVAGSKRVLCIHIRTTWGRSDGASGDGDE